MVIFKTVSPGWHAKRRAFSLVEAAQASAPTERFVAPRRRNAPPSPLRFGDEWLMESK
jgi:hypothetical protein